MYQQVIETIIGLVGNSIIYLDTPISIKNSPHTPPFNVWALQSSNGVFYVMDCERNWYQVDNTKADEDVIGSVYQRVNLLMLNELKTA